MKEKFNTENLVGVHQYHNELQRFIDDADWIGKADDVEHLVGELNHVKKCIDEGDNYYPFF